MFACGMSVVSPAAWTRVISPSSGKLESEIESLRRVRSTVIWYWMSYASASTKDGSDVTNATLVPLGQDASLNFDGVDTFTDEAVVSVSQQMGSVPPVS